MDRSRQDSSVIGWAGVLIMILAAGVPNAFSEDGEQTEDVLEAPDVVVTATKIPTPMSQVTSAVEVITQEAIQRQKFKSVADALRLSQGLTVFSNGGPGTDTSVRIRGGSNTQTLVLIDGAIVNSATQGYYNFGNLTTDNIERIEILRGAQSMLWGSDAMGGVVNIITKRGMGIPQASAFFEYGSFLSIREGGNVAGQKGPVDFSFSLSRWDFTGFSAADYRLGAAERDAFRNWQGSSKVGIAIPHDGRLELAFRWLDGHVNLDNVSNPPRDVFGSQTREQEFIYTGTYDQRITNWWSQKITLARDEDHSLFLPGTLQRNLTTGVFSQPFGGANQTRTISNRIEVQENVQVGKPLLLTAGYQFREQQGENDTGLSSKIVRSNAGFAQAQLNLFDRVFATGGIRQDSYNIFGDATTYRLTGGYVHRETNTKLRSSYATGFRAPAINQLFFPNFGNPNLGPEKSQSMDVGIDQGLFGDRVRLSLGYFWNRYRDLIVNSLNDPTCAPFSTFLQCPLNIGSAVTKGWEAGATVSLIRDRPFIKNLEIQGQYTNTLTRDLSNALRLPRWPVDQWSALLSYQPIDALVVTLAARYVGSRFNDIQNRQSQKAFDVWTLAASYDVTKRIQLYTRAENLFDEKYEEILNAGTAGRSIYVGMKVTL